jgi:hypothetical protein
MSRRVIAADLNSARLSMEAAKQQFRMLLEPEKRRIRREMRMAHEQHMAELNALRAEVEKLYVLLDLAEREAGRQRTSPGSRAASLLN